MRLVGTTHSICEHCLRRFDNDANLNRHWGAPNSACYELHRASLEQKVAEKLRAIPIYDPHDPEEVPCDDEPIGGFEPHPEPDFNMGFDANDDDTQAADEDPDVSSALEYSELSTQQVPTPEEHGFLSRV